MFEECFNKLYKNELSKSPGFFVASTRMSTTAESRMSLQRLMSYQFSLIMHPWRERQREGETDWQTDRPTDTYRHIRWETEAETQGEKIPRISDIGVLIKNSVVSIISPVIVSAFLTQNLKLYILVYGMLP